VKHSQIVLVLIAFSYEGNRGTNVHRILLFSSDSVIQILLLVLVVKYLHLNICAFSYY
jgi:hypothetical protein